MGIVVVGASFVDIKGYPLGNYVPNGRNAGRIVQVHGGVSRNVVEDIANVELRPVYLSVVDDSPLGDDVIARLKQHVVNTDYIVRQKDGLGTWLAIFDNTGDVVASISKRPDLSAIMDVLNEKGDEIVSNCDSIAVEIDMEAPILKKLFSLAQKHNKEIYAVVSNMAIALERRDLVVRTGCLVCNIEEAGLLFYCDFSEMEPMKFAENLSGHLKTANIRKMVVTMGAKGAVYADNQGTFGYCPALNVPVMDTTGAGDAFFAGIAIGLTYGKGLGDSCQIATRLASSVISTNENVCPRFLPSEFDLKAPSP